MAGSDRLPLNILIVEDEPLIALLEREAVEGAGHTVQIAGTGATAMEIIMRGGVDVVLLDHKLPDTVGLELLETIVAKYPDLPVVMVTANGDQLLAVEAMKAGAMDYVTKNFGVRFLETLSLVIDRVFRQKKLEKEKLFLIKENARLATAVQHAGECIVITDAEGIIEYINPAGEELTGYRLAEVRSLAPSVLKSGHHDRAFYDDLWKTIKAGRIWRGHITNRKKDGILYEEDMTISPITDLTGKIVNYIAVKRDITREAALQKARDESAAALRKSERRLRMLNECDEALLLEVNESILLKKICDIIVITGEYRLAWVGFARKDEAKTVFPAAYAGFEEGYLEKANISWADTDRGRGPIGICIRTGEACIANDILTDSRMALWAADAIKRGYRSSIALPLRYEKGTFGALVMYSDKSTAFDVEEIDILSGLADNLARGISLSRIKRDNVRLAAAVHHAGEGVVITNAEGVIEYINPAYEKISGYRMAEVRGHTPRIFKSGLHERAFYGDLWNTITAGRIWHSQIINRKKDGTLYEEMITISPIKDAEGKVVNFVTIRHDISHEVTLRKERENSEAALRKNERRLRMLNRCSEAVLRVAEESILLKTVCDVIVETGGYRLAWVGYAMGDDAKSVLPAAYAGFEEGYLEKLDITYADTERGQGPTGTCIRSGAICIAQNFLTDSRIGPWRADAIKRGYASSISLPLWDEKKLFGALMVYSAKPDAFNADEVNLLEELAENLAYGIAVLRAKKARDEAVMQSEKNALMLHLIADSLPALIAYINPERRFVFVNKQFEKLYGLPLNQIIGKQLWEIQGEELYGRLKENIDRTFAGEAMNYEFDRTFYDGVERHMNIQQAPQFGLGGEVIGIFVLIVDITEQVASRQKAERYRQELLHADKMRALGLLVSTVAHEVNNPLSYMTMNASMAGKIWKDFDTALRVHPSPPESAGGLPFGVAVGEMRKLVGSLSEGADRIGGIVARLKNFSRWSKPRREIVDLNAAVKNAAALTGSLIGHHASSFDMELQEFLPPVKGNITEIEQVLVNLLTNSCQAMLQRPGAIKITTSYRPEIEKVLITVVDEGVGIPPDVVAKLAQPFFTTKGQSGGTGLGLMVSREIMAEHGGMLWFMSEGADKGATAVIEFPVMDGGIHVV